jgi:hypothetical protein
MDATMAKVNVAEKCMAYEQDWRTEYYRGMDVHVSALPRNARHTSWDYTVRVTQPGEDASSESELTAQSGDDADFDSEDSAIQAAFLRGYAMVDSLLD